MCRGGREKRSGSTEVQRRSPERAVGRYPQQLVVSRWLSQGRLPSCGSLCERTETLGCGMQLNLAPAMLNTVWFVPKVDLKVDLGFIRARSVTTGGLFNPPVVTHLALMKPRSTLKSTFSFTKSLLSIAESFQLNPRTVRCTGPTFCGMGLFWSTATAGACP